MGWWKEWVTVVVRWGGEEGRGGGEIEVVGGAVGQFLAGDWRQQQQAWKKKKKKIQRRQDVSWNGVKSENLICVG